MPPKIITTITPKTSGSQGDTSIREPLVDLQVITMGWLKSVIKQIEDNTAALNKRLSDIGLIKVKLLAVK